MKHNIRFISQAAVIAALYVALTWLSQALGLASGIIQFRLSEALCILPCFCPAAVPGLFIGCVIANVSTGCAVPDTLFGSLATLAGALGALLLKRRKWIAPLPNVLINTATVPLILKFVYGLQGSLGFFALTVFIGEAVCCCALGYPLYAALEKYGRYIFNHTDR